MAGRDVRAEREECLEGRVFKRKGLAGIKAWSQDQARYIRGRKNNAVCLIQRWKSEKEGRLINETKQGDKAYTFL